MNNDLISRSELKKAYFNAINETSIGEVSIIDLIDNAPTVEPFEPDYVGAERLKARQRGYEQGYHFGMEIGKTLNPKIKHGKWIIDGHHIRCNRCNEYICNTDREGNKIPDSFCPNCGSDMRETESVRPDTLGCFNCKYNSKRFTEAPCITCGEEFSNWEDRETNPES